MQISKRDPQLFMKRLRKANEQKIRYYLCGEYGGRTWRPHYHLILFNADIRTVQPAWSLGQIHYGTVTGASVGYCLKYMSKKGKVPQHARDDRQPEFALMSKGIGRNYLTDEVRRWHHDDILNRMYCVTSDGKKVSMPRYYKDKLYSELDRKRVGFFQQKRAIEKQRELLEKYGEDYWAIKAISDAHQWELMQRSHANIDKL